MAREGRTVEWATFASYRDVGVTGGDNTGIEADLG
jgi:hypothetical protein